MNKKKTFSGYLGDCSEQQLQTLAKFRNKVHEMGCASPVYDDVYLLRFLRARKFDLEKTLEMWNNFITWRKENNVDNIMNMEFKDVEAAKEHYPHLWFRTDKLGRPIFIERMGKLDFDSLVKAVPLERLQSHFIYDYERLLNKMLPACTKAKGEVVANTCYIMDLKGAAAKIMSSKVWDLLKMASKIGQDYYPEILGHMFIVNAPMFFYGVWNIVKHFVDEKTRNKIHILGSGYKKELIKYIDEKDLPDFLGGKATVEDYGPNLTNEQGPWVDSKVVFEQGIPLMERQNIQNETAKEIQLNLKDKINSSEEDNYFRSLPVLPNGNEQYYDALDREIFDIGQESPLKVPVKSFRPKPSMSFNKLPSVTSLGEF